MEWSISRHPPAGLSRWTQKRGRRYGYSIPFPAPPASAALCRIGVWPTGRETRPPLAVGKGASWTNAFSSSLSMVASSLWTLCPASLKGFGNKGAVNLREGVADRPEARYEVTSPPAIYKDLVILGAGLQEIPSKGPSGAIRAFD